MNEKHKHLRNGTIRDLPTTKNVNLVKFFSWFSIFFHAIHPTLTTYEKNPWIAIFVKRQPWFSPLPFPPSSRARSRTGLNCYSHHMSLSLPWIRHQNTGEWWLLQGKIHHRWVGENSPRRRVAPTTVGRAGLKI